jgi:hypothetical protein
MGKTPAKTTFTDKLAHCMNLHSRDFMELQDL